MAEYPLPGNPSRATNFAEIQREQVDLVCSRTHGDLIIYPGYAVLARHERDYATVGPSSCSGPPPFLAECSVVKSVGAPTKHLEVLHRSTAGGRFLRFLAPLAGVEMFLLRFSLRAALTRCISVTPLRDLPLDAAD